VLVLVVVLVLDLLGFCGKKGIRFPIMILFNGSDSETSAFSSTSTSTNKPFRNRLYLSTLVRNYGDSSTVVAAVRDRSRFGRNPVTRPIRGRNEQIQ
jgi:hypothetical protein